jgi:hypothetical protein
LKLHSWEGLDPESDSESGSDCSDLESKEEVRGSESVMDGEYLDKSDGEQ